MSMILVVPERLKLMAMDASPLIRDGSDHFVKNLAQVKRPFVMVELQTGEYPPAAAGVEEPVEEFTIQIIASKFGEGARDEAENELRQATFDVLTYFYHRPGLQMHNLRKVAPKPLPALTGVQWSRLYMRSYVGAVTRDAPDQGEGPFWGTTLSIRVNSVAEALETLISIDDDEEA